MRWLAAAFGIGAALGGALACSSGGTEDGGGPAGSGGSAASDGAGGGAETAAGGDRFGEFPPHSAIALGSACPSVEPTSGTISGGWRDRASPVPAPVVLSLTTPPGGSVGVLRLEVRTESVSYVDVTVAFEGRLAEPLLDWSLTVGEENDILRAVYLWAVPDREYTVILRDNPAFMNATTYDLDWSYTPVPDCNEPNDTPWSAIDVDFDDVIEGYVAPAATLDPIPPEQSQDWFRIVIPESGTLAVTMEQEGNRAARLRIWNETGEVELGVNSGYTFSTLAEGLPQGTYLFVVEAIPLPAEPNVTVRLDSREVATGYHTAPYRLIPSFEPGPVQSDVLAALGSFERGGKACRWDIDCAAFAHCVDEICYDRRYPPASGLPCVQDAHCRFDDVCEEGLCVPAPPACEVNGDCSEGRTCARGRCMLGTFRPCRYEDECMRGDTCRAGRCERYQGECDDNGQCPLGQTCGVCELGFLCGGPECVDDPLYCRDDTECTEGQVCAHGHCEEGSRTCEGHGDCRLNECHEGVCVETLGVECQERYDCDPNEYCDLVFTGVCRHLCSSDDDCRTSAPGWYVDASGRSFVCREGLTAYGLIDKECRETCATEADCPLMHTCTGGTEGDRYCEVPDVVPDFLDL